MAGSPRFREKTGIYRSDGLQVSRAWDMQRNCTKAVKEVLCELQEKADRLSALVNEPISPCFLQNMGCLLRGEQSSASIGVDGMQSEG